MGLAVPLVEGDILHQFGHVLGLGHQQCAPHDAGVVLDPDAIYNYEKRVWAALGSSRMITYVLEDIANTPGKRWEMEGLPLYDPHSIMCRPYPSEWFRLAPPNMPPPNSAPPDTAATNANTAAAPSIQPTPRLSAADCLIAKFIAPQPRPKKAT
jgi:hypothetical protein